MDIKKAYELSGSQSDKDTWHSYGETYDKLLKPYIDKPINFCEVGLWKGESAKLWSYYFQNENASLDFIDHNQDIINVDDVYNSCYKNERINFHFFDILEIEKNNDFKNKQFDIVIDDGSHRDFHQNISLKYFINKINRGGIIIVEDIRFVEDSSGYQINYPSCLKDLENYEFELIEIPNDKCNDNNLVVYRKP